MDEVLEVVRKLQNTAPEHADAMGELLRRLLDSGGLADPSGDPRLQRSR
jgi:hypothetical protein